MTNRWCWVPFCICLFLVLTGLSSCKPEPKPAAQPAGPDAGLVPAAPPSGDTGGVVPEAVQASGTGNTGAAAAAAPAAIDSAPAGGGVAPASQPIDAGSTAGGKVGELIDKPEGGYASAGKAAKAAADPSLTPLPSLADIDVRRFIDLPGVDIPNEPPRDQFEYAVSAFDLKKVNDQPAVLALLKGMEKTYSTTDGRCEIWIPGAAVLWGRMIYGELSRTTYYIRNADDPYEFTLLEDLRRRGGSDQELVKQRLDNTLKWTANGKQKVHYHKEISQGGLTGVE
ncbi:MAG TPA: hypothetical protein VFB96_25025, partial [Pirellulaceae bacterium]|nr:hypothetical protein [Pirellulaceae bacterium]